MYVLLIVFCGELFEFVFSLFGRERVLCRCELVLLICFCVMFFVWFGKVYGEFM